MQHVYSCQLAGSTIANALICKEYPPSCRHVNYMGTLSHSDLAARLCYISCSFHVW